MSMFKRGTPRSKRSKREMEKLLPKIVENPKQLLILRGQHTSDLVNHALEDIFRLKMPHAKKLQKHNPVLPFENAGTLEFLSHANDSSLVALGTHQKKRPNNLVLGRFFDHQVLDLLELGIVSRHDANSPSAWNFAAGSAMLSFLGDWTGCENVKLFLFDFFRGPEMPRTYVEGLERVIVVSAVVPTEALMTLPQGVQIYVRQFAVKHRAAGSAKVPKVELEEIGPSLDLVVRRSKMATDDNLKAACKQPESVTRATRAKKIKQDSLGQSRASIHVGQQQDFGQFGLRKFKAFKVNKAKERMEQRKRKREGHGAGAGGGGGGAGGEGDGNVAPVARSGGNGEDGEKPSKRFRRDATDRELFVAPQRPEKVKVAATIAPEQGPAKKKKSKFIRRKG